MGALHEKFYLMNNIVAFIFARGGSKGLPGKNIKLLNDKPLIAWSIEHALSSKYIDRVIVSTDSKEIASVASKFGAEVPFIRPDELAQDDSSELLAWRHGLDYIQSSSGSLPNILVSVPATAPLRNVGDIENCIELYKQSDVEMVITISNSNRSPYFNMVKKTREGYVEIVNPPNTAIFRRQDAPKVFDVATVCYVANPEFIMKNDSIFDGRVKAVNIPPERAIDIDTLLDFQIAETLINNKKSV
jgi:CMP-N-acetylneuraminic acid synthetase